MIYRRRCTPLHAARAGVAIGWLAAIGVAVLLCSDPLILGALLTAILVAGWRAQVGRGLAPVLGYAAVMAIAICAINALVSREGFTVIWRFGDLPILGQTNVTLEAVVYGAVLGLRAAALIMLGALYTLAVDPDEVLAAMRRVSFASAVSAAIATRMVPLLLRDSRRLADAQRCRPGPTPGRMALMRATLSGALDRALDAAATLEVRGYSVTAGGQARHSVRRRAWTRQDLAFAAGAALLLCVTVTAAALGMLGFQVYPALGAAPGARAFALAAGLVAVILAPSWAARGVGG